MSRGIEPRALELGQAARPPMLVRGKGGKLEFNEGLPGADIKNTGDFVRLNLSFISPRVREAMAIG